jgi:hypothetical protein
MVSALALAALGCGVELDPPHEVKTLRVLGVQKDAPYAAPGEEVELSILWHDGSPKAPRPVSVAWFSGCVNPPGDLYYGCFETFAGLEPGGTQLPPGVKLGLGDRFAFTIPADIIDSRPPPQDEKLPAYGLAYVFFAVCAGQLGPAPTREGSAQFPIGCFDAAGDPLGPDDFIVGYSAVYAYREFRNQNPIVSGFSFNGVEVPPVCIGAECLQAEPAPLDCSQPNVPCIFGCADDGSDDCPPYPIRPLVDPSIAERDEVSAVAYGSRASEQMWIRYYVDRGSLDSDLRLLNDALAGWNDDHGTKFRAPSEPGLVNVWAVVYDNRGGVNWVRTQVLVQ